MKKNEKQNCKKEPNRRLYKILGTVFAVAFVLCVCVSAGKSIREKRAQEKLEELAAESVLPEESMLPEATEKRETEARETEDPLEEFGIEVPEKQLDWELLKEENKDIYAWIYIPGTQVNYPVLQHETEDDYYLNRNLDGSSGYPGCIYTQLLNSKDFTDRNTILYGHNMKNGTMFGSLHEYEDNTFFEEHPYVYIYTPDETLVYEIFAATTFSNAHLLYEYDFTDKNDLKRYLEDIADVRDMNSHVREDVSVDDEAYLLTLSTCIKNHPGNRWIISAILLNPPAAG